jgi:hypothetical protein
LIVLETEDLPDVLDLDVFHNLVVTGLAYVEELAPKWKDAIVVTTDDAEAGDGKGLGRVSFCQDEGAVFGVATPSIVRVFELDYARDSAVNGDKSMTCLDRLAPSNFLRIWSCLNLAQLRTLSMIPDFATIVSEAFGSLTFLHELLGQFALAAECRAFEGERLLGLRVEGGIFYQGIDENPHVVLDVEGFDRRCLVFLLDLIEAYVRDVNTRAYSLLAS